MVLSFADVFILSNSFQLIY